MYGTDKKVLRRTGFEPMIFMNIYSNTDIKKFIVSPTFKLQGNRQKNRYISVMIRTYDNN